MVSGTQAAHPIDRDGTGAATGSPGARPRVLFVINCLSGGGAERVFALLLAQSAPYRRTHEIRVVLLDRAASVYPLPEWAEVTVLDSRGSLLRSITGLTRLARQWRPQVICAFLTRANIAAVLAARLAGCASVISERVNTRAHFGAGLGSTISRALVRLVYPRATRVVSVAQGVADTLVADFGVRRDRSQVVYNPVDVATIAQRAAEEPAIEVRADDLVVVGRLMPNKNFALAIEAFARLPGARRLLVLGAGPLLADLQELARRLGVAERVVFAGFVANPHAILARAGVFVLSSNAEGFPNALVEAMASGVPVVATNCDSGPAEILELVQPPPAHGFIEGSGGLLVPREDVVAMEQAILAASDAACGERLVASARRRLAAFSVETFVTAFWQAIDGVGAGAGAVRARA